ncbi:MAG: hypothetical protein AB7S78_09845 [Candidatus Omnitrophota bacterium]
MPGPKPRKKTVNRSPFQLKYLLIFVCVVMAAGVVKDRVIKSAIIRLGPSAIGTKIKLGHFSLGLITQKISLKDLVLFNPPGFPDEAFLTIPEITVKSNLWALLRGQIHLPLVVVNVHELIVVKSKDKKLNVDALASSVSPPVPKEGKPAEPPTGPPAKKEIPGMPELKIDLLKLNVDRVIFKDFTKGDSPAVRVYDVGLKNKTIKNVNGVNQLITSIIVQAMGPTAIKGAGIYAAAAVMGVGFLPAGVLGIIVAKDDSTIELEIDAKEAFEICLKYVELKGKLKKQHRLEGVILAKVDGHDLKFEIKKTEKKTVKITVTARKMLVPKPAMAGGVLYQIEQMLRERRP